MVVVAQAQLTEQHEQVHLRDAELDVLPARVRCPLEQAIGAAVVGKLADRWKVSPLLAYGVLELLLGLKKGDDGIFDLALNLQHGPPVVLQQLLEDRVLQSDVVLEPSVVEDVPLKRA